MDSSGNREARELVPGIYCPTQCFFDPETEDVDHGAIAKHVAHLAESGVAGITTNGSNGESVYLSRQERKAITSTTRKTLDKAGFHRMPIIVGASDQSVRGTLALCQDAMDAGGDAVLILVPSFFKWAMNHATIEQYFLTVADGSPLPVIIYNYPGAVAGIDLDSDMLIRLSKHSNIIGTKFTCGNVGKLARVAAATRASHPTERPYLCLSGVADQILPSLAVGAAGAIVGAANVFPKTCTQLYRSYQTGSSQEEVCDLQELVAYGDWAMTKRAIPGFKAVLQEYHGYGGVPRQPMQALDKSASQCLLQEIQKVMAFESNLS